MINKPSYLMQLLGKAIWGGLVLIVSVFLFAFVSVVVSTKVNDEFVTVMIASLIVGPFTATVSLMGFRKIKQKVECIKLSKLVEDIDFFHIYFLNAIILISAMITTFFLLIIQSRNFYGFLLMSFIITLTSVIFIYFHRDNKIIKKLQLLLNVLLKYFAKK